MWWLCGAITDFIKSEPWVRDESKINAVESRFG